MEILSQPGNSPEIEALPAGLREALVARMAGPLALPMLPQTAVQVLATCQDTNARTDRLVELIGRDQALAAHVLRLANSAASAPLAPIFSLPQAIGRLGLGAVGSAALAVALRERVFQAPRHEARIRRLWQHSAVTACYAREITQLLRKDHESAFLCALLHDVGMPIALQCLSDLEREGLTPEQPAPVIEAVMHEFHTELGARLAELWKLGPFVRIAIRHHHEPGARNYHPDDLAIVALADALADWAEQEQLQEGDFVPDAPLLQALRMPAGGLSSLLGRRARVLETARAFQ